MVEKDRSIVVYDAESYAQRHRVLTVDATNEYLLLNHGQDGIISVYDWNGFYCFSIVMTRKGKGVPEVYCCGDEITVFDKNNHVFIYQGDQMLEDHPFSTLEEHDALWSDLNVNRNHLVSLTGTDVVDGNGGVVLTVYGSENTFMKWSLALTSFLIVGLFCYLIIYKKSVSNCIKLTCFFVMFN